MYEISARLSGLWDSYAHKLLCILKMTMVILLVSISPLQASNVFGQRINYVQKQVSLEQIFKEIKKQTRYNIVWFEDNLNPKATQDVNFKNAGIEEVMDRILSNQSASYEINNKTIIIKSKAPSAGEKLKKTILNFFEALIDVTGRVVDESGEPLPGAKVKVNGAKNISTATNVNGEFTLKGIEDKATITISFIGYESKELPVSANMGAIKLAQAEGKLSEIEINAGYYTVKDKERTGSISRITAKDIEKQPVNNVLQAMQANIPGVQITQNTGVPGGGFTVRIRGQNSISQGNDPFYIIDGIPFNNEGLTSFSALTPNPSPLASINPTDIESVEVLKDADATAIYGARGANGVVLITTKRGKPGQNKATISINQGVSRVGHMMSLMKTDQYLSMRREALKNDNLPVSNVDYDLNGTWDQSKYTNWQKELIGKIAPTTNTQVSLSGGTKNIIYLVSGNYYNEGTVFPGDNSYKRVSGNFDLQYTSENKKLTAGVNANYSQLNSNLFYSDITQYITLPPNFPNLLDDNATLNWQDNTMYVNPIANTQQPYKTKTNNLISNAIVSYELFPNFKLKTSFGSAIATRSEFDSTPLYTLPPVLNLGSTSRISDFSNNSSSNYSLDGQMEYNKQKNLNKISVLAGATFQQGIRDLQKVVASGYNNDALMENIAAASTFQTGATYNQYRYTAIFGRLNYGLKEKYFINATGRRDGSSRFGPGKRFSNFGALGTAWIISEEPFVKKNLPFISFAKIRGSYGITGNDQITDYGYLELWNTTGTYQGISTMAPSNIANPNYAWEVNKKAEIALDLNFLNDRISFSTEYYRNRSSSQLVFTSLAPSSGFTSIQDNLPAKIENTGWEFDLRTKNLSSKLLSWSTSVNLTIPKNKLIDYPNLLKSSVATLYAIGQPLSIKKVYNTIINDQSGLYTRQDYDQNGVIDSKDQNIILFVGQKFYGGIQNSFSYKGFSLDFIFQFVQQTGNGFYSGFRSAGQFSPSLPNGNQLVALADHWSSPGGSPTYQKYSTQSAVSTSYNNARNAGNLTVYDASFVRLKNTSLSYNLPLKWMERLKISSAKLFLQGQNLFTITKFGGLDPETQSITRLPVLQVFSAGAQLTL